MYLPSAPAYVAAGVSALLAMAVMLRGRRSLAEWAFAAGMVLLGAHALGIGMLLHASEPHVIRTWLTHVHTLLALLPGTWLLFSSSYARANAASFLNRRRFALAAVFFVGALPALALRPGLVLEVDTEKQTAQLGWPGLLVHVTLLIGLIFVLLDLERTYRTAVGTARWRIKYLLIGLIVLFVVHVYTSSQAVLYGALDLTMVGIQPGALLIAEVLMVRAFLRPGHFAADLYPSQAMLRGSITIILAGSYLLVVGVLAKVVEHIGSRVYFPLQAFVVLISLVVLALGLQSDHVRMRLRRFVSRHFQRPRVDFRTTWQQFAARATASGDVATLSHDVVALIAESFEVLSVTFWIVPERRETLSIAASSLRSAPPVSDEAADPAAVAALAQYFQRQPEPVDLEDVDEPWAEALKRWHPQAFPTGGHRVCIPLVGRGELLGLITLGDRVGGETFNAADLDVFKCVGDHVAASLLNIQLAQRVLQMKELESFQLMATFFVHDLKNAASTLNLLLRNLPDHFHDPAFREDALRGCAKTVAHMNNLISRLTELRQELRVQTVDTDLNAFVARALADFPAPDGVVVREELGPVPAVPLDCEQMRKVLANLLLNAREAIGAAGEIHVSTRRQPGAVELAVADTGCGMSPEFMRTALFRPFQTTKQRGLGIGMFQSKMIVEAHGGRIGVDSTPGRGTTFRITLPCPPTPA